jgi:hypothetical protein
MNDRLETEQAALTWTTTLNDQWIVLRTPGIAVLDARKVEQVIDTLIEARAAMTPRLMAWETEEMMRRYRRTLLCTA